jgi:predicted lipoprotein with Yx(FWY)xxD motif
MEEEMKQYKVAKVAGLSTFFVILALVLAACAPAPTAAPTAAPTQAIPVTGATSTPMPQPSATTAPAVSSSTMVNMTNDAKLGGFLVDAKGMTLYVYGKDTSGVSNCTGQCLANWPALIANGTLTAGSGVTGTLASFTRPDGTKQVTYNNMPLYYFIADKKPGDTVGQGKGGVWFVAPVSGSPFTQPAAASFTVMMKTDPKLGDYLVDAKGMTLYLFTQDTPGASTCTGGCLKAWPALVAAGNVTAGPGVAGKLDVITRADDGSKQVTYNGYPLYYWKKDQAPGDTTGQGIGGVWFVVPPTATTTLPTPAPTAAPTSASAAAPATVMIMNDPKMGNYLVDGKGMTLYIFTKDTAGVSNCSGGCLKAWPPLVASGDPVAGAGVTGKLGVITRADGTKQVTYNDMPLYYWASDTKAGDMTGQGVGGVWYMLSPTAPIK